MSRNAVLVMMSLSESFSRFAAFEMEMQADAKSGLGHEPLLAFGCKSVKVNKEGAWLKGMSECD